MTTHFIAYETINSVGVVAVEKV